MMYKSVNFQLHSKISFLSISIRPLKSKLMVRHKFIKLTIYPSLKVKINTTKQKKKLFKQIKILKDALKSGSLLVCWVLQQ